MCSLANLDKCISSFTNFQHWEAMKGCLRRSVRDKDRTWFRSRWSSIVNNPHSSWQQEHHPLQIHAYWTEPALHNLLIWEGQVVNHQNQSPLTVVVESQPSLRAITHVYPRTNMQTSTNLLWIFKQNLFELDYLGCTFQNLQKIILK